LPELIGGNAGRLFYGLPNAGRHDLFEPFQHTDDEVDFVGLGRERWADGVLFTRQGHKSPVFTNYETPVHGHSRVVVQSLPYQHGGKALTRRVAIGFILLKTKVRRLGATLASAIR
jgi:hypothetical protein